MQFRVVAARGARHEHAARPAELPAFTPLGPASDTRQVSLNEEDSEPCSDVVGPRAALLGTLDGRHARSRSTGTTPITENPALGATEVWEMHNFTEDAHPIHIHEVQFQVVDRQPFDGAPSRPPERWETGFKDTVIAYPGEITRVKALFDLPRPVRLALPHRRARGQRDDAAVLHRTKSPSAVGKGHPLNEEGLTWGPLAWIALVPTCALGRLCQACRGRHGQDSRFEYRSPLFDMSA